MPSELGETAQTLSEARDEFGQMLRRSREGGDQFFLGTSLPPYRFNAPAAESSEWWREATTRPAISRRSCRTQDNR